MPTHRHPRAFFAAQSDFVVAQQGTDIFEPHRSFVELYAVKLCHCVKKVSSGHASGCTQFVATRFEQVIKHQAENVIWRNERSVAIEDSEPVGVAVSRESRERFLFEDRLLQRPEIFVRRVGPATVEKDVALLSNRRHVHSMAHENSIEPTRAATVKGVANKRALGFLDYVEANHFFELREVSFPRIDAFEIVLNILERAGLVAQRCRARLDVFRDLRQGRTALWS